jgi:hypothetical protein
VGRILLCGSARLCPSPAWDLKKSLVGEICGSPIKLQWGCRNLGSRSPRTRCGIARLQLFLFVSSCLRTSLPSPVNATPSGRILGRRPDLIFARDTAKCCGQQLCEDESRRRIGMGPLLSPRLRDNRSNMTYRMSSLADAARFLAITCLVPGFLWSADPLRVLFIGNSLTYVNNSPEIFAELARAQAPGRQIQVQMVTVPGETLLSLWERSNAREVLRSSKWDYVILQEQGALGEGLRDGKIVVNDPALFHWAVRLFDSEIRRQGARTVLMLTWSPKAAPEDQADLNYGYDSIARELGAVLAPVGPAWQEIRAQHPDLEMYQADGGHPSPLGSYLLGWVLVRSLLSGSDTTTLPLKVVGHPVNSGNVDANVTQILVSVKREDAMALQAIATATVRSLIAHGGYLNSPRPVRQVRDEPIRPLREGERFDGRWAGKLAYFTRPANLELELRISGVTCEGSVTIDILEVPRRYQSVIAACAIDGNNVRFVVPMMPVPIGSDQFSGWLAESQLSGTVRRSGYVPLANSMTGSWSLQHVNSR